MSTPIATEYSTDTILGMMNQYYAMLGTNIEYKYLANTTLNTKYNIFKPQQVNGTWSNVPAQGKVPSIGYFGVGIRGFYNITADDEISPLSQPYSPKATEMDLYRPIPIRCVPAEYDLDSAEKKKYRMRTELTVDGNAYVCYWLKKVEFDSALNLYQVDSAGTETTYDINNTVDQLTPSPAAPTTPTVVSGSNKIIVAANIKCEITGAEILEAINVIYHGDLRRARISEWGIYTGYDEEVTDPNNVAYTEAKYVQLAAKRCTTGVDMSNTAAVQQEILTIQNGNLLLLD